MVTLAATAGERQRKASKQTALVGVGVNINNVVSAITAAGGGLSGGVAFDG
jgi:hypothetical protein